MEYIDINKEELPESFELDLGNETFTLSFAYNETGDFFTVSLYKLDVNGRLSPLVIGEKLVLNRPLWSELSSLELPAPTLIPLDISNTEKRITWDNLGVSVFLYIDNEGEANE
ncbi:MAG: phage baseplate plug family protein [Bacillota bacterium]